MNIMNTLHLVISSVSENLYDGPARSVTVPGSAGEMTILPNHEPLISTLKKGSITVRIPNAEEKTFPVENGVIETAGERTVVLV